MGAGAMTRSCWCRFRGYWFGHHASGCPLAQPKQTPTPQRFISRTPSGGWWWKPAPTPHKHEFVALTSVPGVISCRCGEFRVDPYGPLRDLYLERYLDNTRRLDAQMLQYLRIDAKANSLKQLTRELLDPFDPDPSYARYGKFPISRDFVVRGTVSGRFTSKNPSPGVDTSEDPVSDSGNTEER